MMKEEIQNYAQKHSIFTIDELKTDLHLTDEDDCVVQKTLDTLQQEDVLKSYEQGIYGYKRMGTFIKRRIAPSVSIMLAHVYLKNDAGYVTDGDFALAIGLTDWCPAVQTIVSNRVQETKSGDGFIVKKPRIAITTTNKDYLQLLDCIENLKNLPVNSAKCHDILHQEIAKKDKDYLLELAKLHYDKNTVDYISKSIDKECYMKID